MVGGVLSTQSVTLIATGTLHSLALSSGTVFGWGNNELFFLKSGQKSRTLSFFSAMVIWVWGILLRGSVCLFRCLLCYYSCRWTPTLLFGGTNMTITRIAAGDFSLFAGCSKKKIIQTLLLLFFLSWIGEGSIDTNHFCFRHEWVSLLFGLQRLWGPHDIRQFYQSNTVTRGPDPLFTIGDSAFDGNVRKMILLNSSFGLKFVTDTTLSYLQSQWKFLPRVFQFNFGLFVLWS